MPSTAFLSARYFMDSNNELTERPVRYLGCYGTTSSENAEPKSLNVLTKAKVCQGQSIYVSWSHNALSQ